MREFLPDASNMRFDHDDVLPRALYHFEKSLRQDFLLNHEQESKKEFTKGVFKFCFYLCLRFDPKFRSTSIRAIVEKVYDLTKEKKVDSIVLNVLKNSILFRRSRLLLLGNDFEALRTKFL